MASSSLTSINAVLKRLEKKYGGNVSVIVGYPWKPRTSKGDRGPETYSIYVHEDLTKNHEIGQAKFLEQPARQLRREIGQAVVTVTQKTGSLKSGLIAGGELLKTASQALVPVDTGALHDSAFVAVE